MLVVAQICATRDMLDWLKINDIVFFDAFFVEQYEAAVIEVEGDACALVGNDFLPKMLVALNAFDDED